MLVNLKQTEIENALKGYISQQGISLVGKHVTVDFTAGRKQSGISAAVTIEDVDMPDFGQVEQPVLVAVVSAPVVQLQAVAVEAPEAEPVPEVAAVIEEAEPAPKTNSIFG